MRQGTKTLPPTFCCPQCKQSRRNKPLSGKNLHLFHLLCIVSECVCMCLWAFLPSSSSYWAAAVAAETPPEENKELLLLSTPTTKPKKQQQPLRGVGVLWNITTTVACCCYTGYLTLSFNENRARMRRQRNKGHREKVVPREGESMVIFRESEWCWGVILCQFDGNPAAAAAGEAVLQKAACNWVT